MKFNCEKNIILKAVSIAQDVISSHTVISILSNVLLIVENDSLYIKASDLKIGFETSIPVEVIHPGKISIFCDKFYEILRSLPDGEVEFEIGDNQMFYIKTRFKRIDFNLKSVSADKFPELPEISHDRYFEFSQKDLIEMIGNTIFAISDDETRFFMNGVYMEKVDNRLIMVASDGRRLSYIFRTIKGNFDDIKGIIIPAKILNILRKLLPGDGNLYIAITEKNIFIKFGSHKFSSNLIEGKFPNYQKVIPETQNYKITVQKSNLENAVKRVSLMVEQKSRRIYLYAQRDNLIISSDQVEMGMAKEEIPCQYGGPEGTIVLNYVYLLDPLKEIKEDEICIQFTQTDKTVSVTTNPDNNSLHIIMPMQKK
ncbi:MAG: DNA polymerase III subunit beta [Spirochaetales bacterium]|nr:DNA polymerase III subunit beta [Spirochaetales bacterium]